MSYVQDHLSRRDFLRNTACTAAATGAALSSSALAADVPAGKTPALPYGVLVDQIPGHPVSFGAILTPIPSAPAWSKPASDEPAAHLHDP